jgi:hypothetical protein
MNKIYIPATKPEDWKSLLADPKHWRQGYSAMALAYCWQNANGFPTSIKRVFNKSKNKLFNNVDILLSIPEYKVGLPGGARASQNDIFVLAKSKGQLISIMVEGKVDEKFGPLVSEWFKKPSQGKKKRLAFLCKEIGLKQSMVSNIRYQLLHRTASAIIEAKKFNALNALMLVHSFSPENLWFDDYAAFLSLYGIEAKLNQIHEAGNFDKINLFFSWIKGEKKYLKIKPDEGI